MFLQRYLIIVGTAFGGAWTMIVGRAGARRRAGAGAESAERRLDSVSHDPAPGERWVPVAWIVLGLVGTACSSA